MTQVVVRTRLQAIIVAQLIRDGVIAGSIRVLTYRSAAGVRSGGRGFDAYIARLGARETLLLDRWRLGNVGMTLRLVGLLWRCRLTREPFFVANLDWYPLALALRLVPGMRIRTFDDGTANFSLSYLTEAPTDAGGLEGWLARRLFPKGAPHAIRSWIECHYTVYPHKPNVVPPERLRPIRVDWAGLMAAEDRARLPPDIHKIFLGSVYEGVTYADPRVLREKARQAIAWADLHLPHPRDSSAQPPPAFGEHTAETIIAHYAARHEIVVAHFNSSAAVPFESDPRVRLVNLLSEPLPRSAS